MSAEDVAMTDVSDRSSSKKSITRSNTSIALLADVCELHGIACTATLMVSSGPNAPVGGVTLRTVAYDPSPTVTLMGGGVGDIGWA